MVHQHFKLVECFTVLDNIILGVEPNKMGFLQKAEARKKVMALSEKYGLRVDPDALVSDISVGHAAACRDPQDAVPGQRDPDL